MIVCCCFGTTDREIRSAFGPGGSRRCPAGQGCGNCIEMVRAIVAQTRTQAEPDDSGEDSGSARGSRPRS